MLKGDAHIMEDLIQQLIETDGRLRARVVEAQKKLEAFQIEDGNDNTIDAQKYAEQEARKIVSDARSSAEEAAKYKEKQYKEQETQLRELFQTHRTAWIAEIVQGCLRLEDKTC